MFLTLNYHQQKEHYKFSTTETKEKNAFENQVTEKIIGCDIQHWDLDCWNRFI